MTIKRERPATLKSTTYGMKTGCGKMYVTVTEDDLGIAEIFLAKGKTGGCTNSLIAITARLSSVAMRSGVPPGLILDQFEDATCPESVNKKPIMLSCGDAIAEAIRRHMQCIADRPENRGMILQFPEPPVRQQKRATI